MKQEQTIDDILKLLKDSINDQTTPTEEAFDSIETHEAISEEVLKERLQKQYGEQTAEPSETVDSYAIDDDFLQEAVTESDEEIPTEIEEAESVEEIEVTEEIEEIEESEAVTEILCEETPLAIDYDDVEEEIEYELLPRVGEEIPTGVILRDQPTDAVRVGPRWELVSEEENESTLLEGKEEKERLSGVTYTTPALAENFGSLDEEEESSYDLMRQFGCEDEWQSEELPLTAEEEEEESIFEIDDDLDIISAYQKKKLYAILRIAGSALIAILLFFYETLPLFDISFGGILNYQEYLGAYLLMGFQLLFIATLIFGKRMGEGALRIFSLRPNVYSVVSLCVIGVLVYDIIATFALHDWVAPFHFAVSLLLLILSISEYLLLSRELKILSVVSLDSDYKKYTLEQLTAEDRCVAKMMRGGLSEEERVAIPELCDDTEDFFSEARERCLGLRTASILLLPSLLLSIIMAIVTLLLNRSLSETMLTAISMLLITIPLSATVVVSFPLWFSANRLAKRQIALSGCEQMGELSETDVLIFEDMHLFRPCSTADTGIAFYEKKQTAQILGCLECLYAHLGGPLSEAFANIPEQYRFHTLAIRRLMNGGVEALIERKHTFLAGDAAFMKRYGLNFPNTEEKAGRTTVYISLDGKISAKMSVRYQPEPTFEMLVERLYQEGTQCVIKTFDPMISAARISSIRTMGNSPISVIHQSIGDLNESQKPKKQTKSAMGVLAVASRFKLIEALSWSRALVRVRRRHQGMMVTISLLGLAAICLLVVFDKMQLVNQYWLILWGILSHLLAVLITTASMPSKKYFSVDAYREEWEKEQQRKRKKQKGNK